MTGFNMHVYEMLCRVVVFSEKYPYLFGPGTLAAELIEKVREAAMRLSEHAATQTSKKGAFRQGVDDREAARLLERSFDDNPLGQSDEQTPIGIWREIS